MQKVTRNVPYVVRSDSISASSIVDEFQLNVACAQNFFKVGGIVEPSNTRVAVISREVPVKNHETIRAEQHQIARVNLLDVDGIARQIFGEVKIFLVAVEFALQDYVILLQSCR